MKVLGTEVLGTEVLGTEVLALRSLRRSGPEEIRTPNPLHAMEVRYRCATGPEFIEGLAPRFYHLA